ncbi:hypothetical protein OH77DRAFT_1410769 [Trametes cingulata]|nr:hypothetical protein OH77DRAFT_1410769 [Trametes cingulata]
MPKESQLAVLTYLDFPALMVFRRVSKSCRALVLVDLERDLKRILAPITKNWDGFRDSLSASNGYIGGLAALAFFFRRSMPQDEPIEVFLPSHTFPQFVEYLREVQGLVITAEYDGDAGRYVVSTVRLQCLQRAILVHRSATESALCPILRASNTALACYVGASDFGVPWAALTFARRALVADRSACAFNVHIPRLPRAFSIRLYAWMWPEYGDPQTCTRQHHMCPAQPRYLDDAGAIYGSWSGTEHKPRTRICFRLDARPCGGPCLQPHPTLPFSSDRVRIL